MAGGVDLGSEAEAFTVVVIRKERSRGLGGTLLGELLAHMRNGGAEDVLPEVCSRDPVAQKLYSGKGFVVVGLCKGYYNSDDTPVICLGMGEASRGSAGGMPPERVETPVLNPRT